VVVEVCRAPVLAGVVMDGSLREKAAVAAQGRRLLAALFTFVNVVLYSDRTQDDE
jgi:hypothetical protein